MSSLMWFNWPLKEEGFVAIQISHVIKNRVEQYHRTSMIDVSSWVDGQIRKCHNLLYYCIFWRTSTVTRDFYTKLMMSVHSKSKPGKHFIPQSLISSSLKFTFMEILDLLTWKQSQYNLTKIYWETKCQILKRWFMTSIYGDLLAIEKPK